MSGGVDSSVAALLLLKQGYQVSGLFMKNWQDDDPDYPCTAKEDAMDALAVCDVLDISMDAVSFVDEYRERVFQHFLDEYQQGRTPNPDILCNKEIKFNAFLNHALNQGADLIATGHYARITQQNGLFSLLKGKDNAKDQSYFLYTLGQAQLARTVFPLGELAKTEVRELAQDAQFPNAQKKDSTGICFIGERRFKPFLQRYLGTQKGDIRSIDGELLGSHDGLMFYTLGQRQGLGIGGRRGDSGAPWFVVAKKMDTNTLIVVQGEQHPSLYCQGLNAEQLHWIGNPPPHTPYRCAAKTRYRQKDQPCTIEITENSSCTVTFNTPQRAVTPGQSVVFYIEDQCLGGGIIAEALP